MAAKKTETLEVRSVEIERVSISIVGDSPLIVHAWSEKAKRQMLEAQMKATKTKGHDPKNPVEDFINSLYWVGQKPTDYTEEAFAAAVEAGAQWGVPVTAIKQAAASGGFRSGALKDRMGIRGSFFIEGVQVGGDTLAVIEGPAPVMREDMVKVGMGTADLRYRGMFESWRMNLTISYNKNGPISLEQIVNLINLGGYMVGIGEWRPERDGQYGMFHVAAS